MFDSLLGRKFSAKCKHSIKCINCRIVPIRKKKQVVLRILKKDVADLLSTGFDINAFRRIEGLMIEINQISCYDMIEQFCNCILKQLPCLQKQRDCTEEAMEAVSTLIYAAARFPDLPELCDLRHVFTERYGSHMESFVNAEFVEKIRKKTFSMDKKLQLMRNIAQESSIDWNSNAFEQKLSNPITSESDHPKGGSLCNGNGRSPMLLDGRNEAAINMDKKEIPSRGRCETTNRSMVQKQVQTETKETKDIHVISSVNNRPPVDSTVKTRKVFADEPENVKPYHDILTPYVKLKDCKNGTHKEVSKGVAYGRSLRAQEGPVFDGLERQEVRPLNSMNEAIKMVPPYTKSRGMKNGTNTEEQHKNDIAYNRSTRAQQEPHEQQVSVDCKAINMSSDNKSRGSKSGTNTKEQWENGIVYSQSTKAREVLDLEGQEGLVPTGQERWAVGSMSSNSDRKINMVPPYVKPKANILAAHIDHTKSADPLIDEYNGGEDKDPLKDNLFGAEKPKPRSVRRKHPKQPMVHEIDSNIDEDKLVNRIPSGRRIVPRQSTGTFDDERNEENIMDQLLVHYSKKGMSKKSSKSRTMRNVLPTDHAINVGEVAELQSNARPHLSSAALVHPPERLVSLPPELISSTKVVKGPTRTTSMQPELLSPKSEDVYPWLPDYEKFTARFSALRKA